MSQSHYHLHSVLPHAVMLTTAGVPLDSCGKIFWDFAGFFLGEKKKKYLPVRFCKGGTKVYLGRKLQNMTRQAFKLCVIKT